MYAIPVEILLEIGKTDLETYKGMLAIPKFARGVTIGYRLDIMAAHHKIHSKLLNFCYHGVCNYRKVGSISYELSIKKDYGHFLIGDTGTAYFHPADIHVVSFNSVNGMISNHYGSRSFQSGLKFLNNHGDVIH